ncbi:hypothetical protein NE237_000086 [Protea cynaroides]|uniref:Uncharacterized protein n=1 Tax=Protea cynaroides TaxID=273540 RepID=A0A9Q0JQT5_9MAGN|nr:hypothetical protein NE237_000086 [Protea cynaroides]
MAPRTKSAAVRGGLTGTTRGFFPARPCPGAGEGLDLSGRARGSPERQVRLSTAPTTRNLKIYPKNGGVLDHRESTGRPCPSQPPVGRGGWVRMVSQIRVGSCEAGPVFLTRIGFQPARSLEGRLCGGSRKGFSRAYIRLIFGKNILYILLFRFLGRIHYHIFMNNLLFYNL